MSAGVAGLNSASSAYSVSLSAAPYEITSLTANFGGTQAVSFDGYGTPNNGGTVVVAAPRFQSTVTLDAATGLATITRSNAGGLAPE
jgi:hypothetical protein